MPELSTETLEHALRFLREYRDTGIAGYHDSPKIKLLDDTTAEIHAALQEPSRNL